MPSKSIHVLKSQNLVLFRKLRGLPWSLSVTESTCHHKRHERPGFDGPRRSPGEGNGNHFQDSCLENPMHTGACAAKVHGSQESDMTEMTQHACIQPHMVSGTILAISNRVYFIFLFCQPALLFFHGKHFILNIAVFTHQSQTPLYLSHHSSPLVTLSLFSKSTSLFQPANKFTLVQCY